MQLIIIYFVCQQLKHVIDSDAAISEDTIAYNIIPLEAHVTTNAITGFPGVRYFPHMRLCYVARLDL